MSERFKNVTAKHGLSDYGLRRFGVFCLPNAEIKRASQSPAALLLNAFIMIEIEWNQEKREVKKDFVVFCFLNKRLLFFLFGFLIFQLQKFHSNPFKKWISNITPSLSFFLIWQIHWNGRNGFANLLLRKSPNAKTFFCVCANETAEWQSQTFAYRIVSMSLHQKCGWKFNDVIRSWPIIIKPTRHNAIFF